MQFAEMRSRLGGSVEISAQLGSGGSFAYSPLEVVGYGDPAVQAMREGIAAIARVARDSVQRSLLGAASGSFVAGYIERQVMLERHFAASGRRPTSDGPWGGENLSIRAVSAINPVADAVLTGAAVSPLIVAGGVLYGGSIVSGVTYTGSAALYPVAKGVEATVFVAIRNPATTSILIEQGGEAVGSFFGLGDQNPMGNISPGSLIGTGARFIWESSTGNTPEKSLFD